jgi:hypothetical protein
MRGKGKNNKWNRETVSEEMRKHQYRSDFQKASIAAYRYARLNGMLDDRFKDLKEKRVRKWTIEKITSESKKYKSRSHFSRGSASAYNAAKELGILKDLFGFEKRQWTSDSMRNEMRKFSTRTDFYRNSGSAYCTALKKFKKEMDEILPITTTRNGCDDDVIYIWRAVGQFFNGNPVYKIGVTSSRLGNRRIEQVANQADFEYELICCELVQGKATDIEKKLHILGENPNYLDINGCTEFRALSDSALYVAISMICEVSHE